MRCLVVLALIGLSSAAFAGSCSWASCTAEIKTLFPNEDGTVRVEMDADMTQLDCTLREARFATLESSTVLRDDMYSMMLAAMISGRELTIRTEAGSSNCRIMYTLLES